MNLDRTLRKAGLLAVAAVLVLAAIPASAQDEAPTLCLDRPSRPNGIEPIEYQAAAIDPAAPRPEWAPQACSPGGGGGTPPSLPRECQVEVSFTVEGLPFGHTTGDLGTICAAVQRGNVLGTLFGVIELIGGIPGLPSDLPDRIHPDTGPLAEVMDCVFDGASICSANVGGNQTVKCSVLGYVCALAGAHAEKEEIDDSPDFYNHFASGGGMSPGGVTSGYAVYRTALGNGRCDFDPNSGCGETFSDIKQSQCIRVWAVATAFSGPFNSGAAEAVDSSCNDD